jgi:hypothetical protein
LGFREEGCPLLFFLLGVDDLLSFLSKNQGDEILLSFILPICVVAFIKGNGNTPSFRIASI